MRNHIAIFFSLVYLTSAVWFSPYFISNNSSLYFFSQAVVTVLNESQLLSAISSVNAGDLINVTAGIYNFNNTGRITLGKNGNETHRITLHADQVGSTIIIFGSDATLTEVWVYISLSWI